jgi:PAS domain-containing protein
LLRRFLPPSIVPGVACSRFHATLRDAQGRLIATPESERILQPVLNQLPGAADALARHTVTRTDGHLRTLLDTSSAVVTSLDPRAVGGTIIGEAQRLVDVQAATALVPDEDGVLRVLVSDGRDEHYQHAVRIRPDGLGSPAALALRDGRAVQLVAGNGSSFPPLSYAEGFQAVLAIPIISRHVGGVVLVMHRTQPQRFTAHGGDLLLTFANYATLAWEHAVLYERSDERLREVARENERLYRQATAEKQTLAAIMRSMSDGLILTSVEGRVLYANPGARRACARALRCPSSTTTSRARPR